MNALMKQFRNSRQQDTALNSRVTATTKYTYMYMYSVHAYTCPSGQHSNYHKMKAQSQHT